MKRLVKLNRTRREYDWGVCPKGVSAVVVGCFFSLVLGSALFVSGCSGMKVDSDPSLVRVSVVAFEKSYLDAVADVTATEFSDALLSAWRKQKACKTVSTYTINLTQRHKVVESQMVYLPTGYQYPEEKVKPEANVMNYEKRSIGTMIDAQLTTNRLISLHFVKEFVKPQGQDLPKVASGGFSAPTIGTVDIRADVPCRSGDQLVLGNFLSTTEDDKCVFLVVSQ